MITFQMWYSQSTILSLNLIINRIYSFLDCIIFTIHTWVTSIHNIFSILYFIQIMASTRIIPDYCKDCSWFYEKMGACPIPNVSLFYSYISLIPYMLIFALIGLSLIKRKYSYLRITTALVIAYILGDKILKNIFLSKI
jgi:hypothetical protein